MKEITSEVQGLSLVAEAVGLLEENKRLRQDLAERTELLKVKCLSDKNFRHRVESELTKALIFDFEQLKLSKLN